MNSENNLQDILKTLQTALEDIKAQDIVTIDLTGASQFADIMVVVSGTSTRHVAAIARNIQEAIKQQHTLKPIGVEGEETSEWILVDFGDLILHIMLPATRSFYELEKLWRARPQDQIEPTAEPNKE